MFKVMVVKVCIQIEWSCMLCFVRSNHLAKFGGGVMFKVMVVIVVAKISSLPSNMPKI